MSIIETYPEFVTDQLLISNNLFPNKSHYRAGAMEGSVSNATQNDLNNVTYMSHVGDCYSTKFRVRISKHLIVPIQASYIVT